MFDTVSECPPRSVLPDGLAEMAPGPELALALAGLDRKMLNGHEMVIVLQARSRLVSHFQAELYADIMEVALSPPGDASSAPERIEQLDEDSSAEIGAALRLTRRAADIALGTACDLVERVPEVWQALFAGEIDLPRARVICDHTGHLPEDQAREVARVILGEASGLTTGQLAARLRRLTISVDAEDSRHRYQTGVEERRVVGESNLDGTANLLAFNLPPETVVAALERVNRLAKEANTSGDQRSIDQIRADVFCDLVSGRGLSAASAGVVDITVDLVTLTGLSEVPGEIPGWGPVIADIARQVALANQRGWWRVNVTDPKAEGCGTGPPEDDPQQPSAATSWPGNRCVSSPGAACQPGTATSTTPSTTPKGDATHPHNLGPLCRYHHRLKHEAGWKIEQPTPGRLSGPVPSGTPTTHPIGRPEL